MEEARVKSGYACPVVPDTESVLYGVELPKPVFTAKLIVSPPVPKVRVFAP